MKISTMTNVLWGNQAKWRYLMVASILLLFTFLGARDLWTQEHRWADIVSGMFFRHDFLHPYLGDATYYDKPLLSYWLMAVTAKVIGQLNLWALRLPSVFSGLLAIWSIFRLGTQLKNKQLGFLSSWMLITTFYFVFWARISSADMLNVAGTLFAIAWYFDHRKSPSFFNYAIFFLIVALTSLCKGLVGAVVPAIAVMVDIVLQKSWKQHLRLPLFLAMLPALVIYLAPFIASSVYGGESYGENGLYLVYRENILRYFKPFDHQGPIYTYFLYLPIYLMPWTLFFIPALISLKSRWRTLSIDSKWVALTLLALFAFFTVSGSRRSYYVLPLVPFAVLFTADWILSGKLIKQSAALIVGIISFGLTFLMIDVLVPLYYLENGMHHFANVLKDSVSRQQSWKNRQVVMLDGETKLNFYLSLPPSTQNLGVIGDRSIQNQASLLAVWPVLKNPEPNTIYITRALYVPYLKELLPHYRIVSAEHTHHFSFIKQDAETIPVAFVPETL